MQYPKVAYRSCDDCQKWEYDEKTGQRLEDRRLPTLYVLRRGPTPCRTPDGCPKGTPEDSKALTFQNWLAYRHYLECKAVGNFPDDPIVKQNAGIIREVEDLYQRMKQETTLETLKALLSARIALPHA